MNKLDCVRACMCVVMQYLNCLNELAHCMYICRGGQAQSYGLFICIVIYISMHASRELNVIDSGTVTQGYPALAV